MSEMQINPAWTSQLSLSLPDELSFERWQIVGRELAARDKCLNWWIGDWWAFGEHRYGERAKIAAEGCFGIGFGALRNYGSVCRAIETSRRRDTLGWSVHQETAALAPDQADVLLDRAERDNLTVAQVRTIVRQMRQTPERAAQVIEGPIEPLPAEWAVVRKSWLLEVLNELGCSRALTDYESEVLEDIISNETEQFRWTADLDRALLMATEINGGIARLSRRIKVTPGMAYSRIHRLRAARKRNRQGQAK